MGFWTKLARGLAIIGQILVYAAAIEVVGGRVNLPAINFNGVDGRDFDIEVAVVRRR